MSYRLELEPEDLRHDEGGPGRRRVGAVVLVVLMVMAGSAAGLWAAYRVMEHHAGSVAVPILRADERPVKVPPANPGGMEVPDQDMYILNRERPPDSKVEQLLPPPETPLPRPVAAAPAVTETPPPASPAASPPTVPNPAPAAPPAAASAASIRPAVPPEAAASPARVPSPIPAPVAAPAGNAGQGAVASAAPAVASVPEAMPPAEAAPAALAAGTGFRLQIGSVRTPEAAQQEWTRLKRAQADVLGALAAQMRRIDLGDRGVYYRIEAGPFADQAAAEHACDALKQRKVGCILVRP